MVLGIVEQVTVTAVDLVLSHHPVVPADPQETFF
jgi:hypothetical protein